MIGWSSSNSNFDPPELDADVEMDDVDLEDVLKLNLNASWKNMVSIENVKVKHIFRKY